MRISPPWLKLELLADDYLVLHPLPSLVFVALLCVLIRASRPRRGGPSPACATVVIFSYGCDRTHCCSGDSWRARVSHICELQVNLASGAMTIDFGGLDRWDYAERARNMEEAVRPVT